MTPPHVLVEHDGPVCIVTMNRPERLNAMSDEMYVRLARAWADAQVDGSVRVVVITGAGGTFTAGGDLNGMARGGPLHAEPTDEWGRLVHADEGIVWRALLRDRVLRKPIVAAVEGVAVAGGTELLHGTDVRIAGEGARFGVPEVRWGIVPMGGATVRLRRQIPHAVAMDMLLTGRQIDAATALQVGLVSRLVPAGSALDAAREVAREIAANGPLAVQAVLDSVAATDGMPEEEALATELRIGRPVMASDDVREGAHAFLERRPPRFTGT